MKNQQELFELFMHNNMLPEPFDPDKVLAAAREAVPDYQPSEQFTKGMDKLLQKSKRRLIKFMTVIPVTVRIRTAGKPLTRKLTPVT